MPETTDKKQDTRFKPGQSGNPAGRPKGSRNKYSEHYIADIASAWEQHGPRLLAEWASNSKTHDLFLRAVTAGLSKDMSLNVSGEVQPFAVIPEQAHSIEAWEKAFSPGLRAHARDCHAQADLEERSWLSPHQLTEPG
jgi:Family of unknown function (DUF5681)